MVTGRTLSMASHDNTKNLLNVINRMIIYAFEKKLENNVHRVATRHFFKKACKLCGLYRKKTLFLWVFNYFIQGKNFCRRNFAEF